MDFQIIYDVVESNYSNMECYSIIEYPSLDYVTDVKLKKSQICVDRDSKKIYFFNMNVDEHFILAKMYYSKIIKEFLDNEERYNIKGYTVSLDTTGGQIYKDYVRG